MLGFEPGALCWKAEDQPTGLNSSSYKKKKSISKCVCSFVKFPLDVIELSSYSFVDVVGGMGEIFKELEEDEVIGEEVRVGGVSTILEKENDKIRVAVKNTGDRPPLKISVNGKL